jgi:hypothetical protein
MEIMFIKSIGKSLGLGLSLATFLYSKKSVSMEENKDLSRSAICLLLPENDSEVHGIVSFHQETP